MGSSLLNVYFWSVFSRFIMFSIRQFYFLHFITPAAAGTLIWGNTFFPQRWGKDILSSNAFCFLLMKFFLAKPWPADRHGQVASLCSFTRVSSEFMGYRGHDFHSGNQISVFHAASLVVTTIAFPSQQIISPFAVNDSIS